jgi:hypothetical protein
MFKKIALMSAVIVTLSSGAYAQGYHRGGHGGGYYGGGYGGGWAAPFVGGAIIGGILGSMTAPRYYAPPPVYVAPSYAPPLVYAPACYNRFLGYDAYGRPVHDRVCN